MQKKLLATYILLIIFACIITGYFSLAISQTHYTDQLNQQLITHGQLLIQVLENDYEQNHEIDYQRFAERYGKVLNNRITIMDYNGSVLGDSHVQDPTTLENHGGRPEVKKAFEGEIGVSTRYSESIGVDLLYTAIPFQIEELRGIIRLSLPLIDVRQMKWQIINYSVTGMLVAGFISMIVAFLFSRKFAEPINELTAGVWEIAKGNYNKKIYIHTNDQIGQLADAFNTMTRELKYTVAELRDRNTKLESIVNSMINGIIAIDHDYNIMLINPICYMLFSIEDEDVHHRQFYDVIRNQYLFDILEKSMNNEEYVIEEFAYQTRHEKILRVYANPIISKYVENRSIGTLLVIQDITQIRKLEKMRSDFVSNVSHELKTPLTSIRGFVDTLRNGAIDDQKVAKRFLDIIDVEADRLYRLIQDILSLSEIETREKDINMGYNLMKQMVDEVVAILRPRAEEKGILLGVRISPKDTLLYCNQDRIKQMLINLIDNAIKYTEKGEVQISCIKEADKIKITIRDSGIGIPKEHISRLFERFYRVDRGRSRKMGGTGLGLSIVKHIVKLYEGDIQVESKLGQGSIFTVILPQDLKDRV